MNPPSEMPARLSGHWTGFTYQSGPAHKRRLDVLFQVRNHQISGVGDDDAGMFVLTGEFDAAAQEFRWVQTHLFGHTLYCRGFCDADRIWGTWQDAGEGHGGFQIWPLPARERTDTPVSRDTAATSPASRA